MKQKANLHSFPKDALQAMMELENYTKETSVSVVHKNLIKTRASQINECVHCLDMHTKEARRAGETEQRINALSNWRQSGLFRDDEKLILELTEAITLISEQTDTTNIFDTASQVFAKEYLSEVVMIIITINSWNRFVRCYDLLLNIGSKAELSS